MGAVCRSLRVCLRLSGQAYDFPDRQRQTAAGTLRKENFS